MKKIVKLLLMLVFITSCDKDKTFENTFNDTDFVSFENISSTTVSIGEDQAEGRIKISMTKPQDTPTTIQLSVVENGTVNVGYALATDQIVIPAGEVDGFVVINPVDDDLNTPSTSLTLTITTVTNNLKIGLREEGSFKKNVIIVNDDCPTKFNIWFGTISCEDVGFGSTPGIGSANANGDCDILKVDNDLPGAGGTAITDNFEFTLTPDFPGATTGTVSAQPIYMGDRNFTIGGVSTPCEMLYYTLFGVYDETSKTINIDYYMRVKAKTTGTVYNWYAGQNVIVKQ